MTLTLKLTLLGAALMAVALFAFSPAAIAADAVYTKGGYAIQGYDPVAYFTDHKPIKGDEAFMATYQGAQWLFANAEHKAMFEAEPEKYAPQYGGWCAYAAGKGNGKLVRTNPKAFDIHAGKLYLNFSPAIQEDWAKSKAFFINRANKNYPNLIN